MPNVNEKTLELNVTHEILSVVHRFDRQAFAFGTTLTHEGHLGFDSRILSALPGLWGSGVLQYKRPYEMRHDQRHPTYWFKINNNRHHDQHHMLLHFSAGRPNTTFYVFPVFLDLRELEQHVTGLLGSTYFADATDIPSTYVGAQEHDVEVLPHLLLAIVHSEKATVKIRLFESLLPLVQERKFGLPIKSLLGNARKKVPTAIRTKRARFHFMALPGPSNIHG